MADMKKKVFLYPKIRCHLCSYYTTKSESLGEHLVDKHTDKIVVGYKKVTKKQSTKTKSD